MKQIGISRYKGISVAFNLKYPRVSTSFIGWILLYEATQNLAKFFKLSEVEPTPPEDLVPHPHTSTRGVVFLRGSTH